MGKLHLAKLSKPEFLAYDVRNYKKGEKYINKFRDKGAKLVLWTINSPEKLALAREVADRVIFMDGGYIVEEGSPEEIFKNTKQERTKQFLSKVL